MFGPRLKTTRKLEITRGGWWFIVFTIGMGVVALSSGNNIFYLIESLLLSGLILSGVLSERVVSAIYFEIKRHPVSAQSHSHDRILIRNRKRFPVYCVEVGEWVNGSFVPVAFVPKIDGRSETWTGSIQRFDRRGTHEWEGIAVATSYPFGFARKVRLIREPGKRIIWPRRRETDLRRMALEASTRQMKAGTEVIEGEVRQMNHSDDLRDVVWTLSARGNQTPYVRMRRNTMNEEEIFLDRRIRGNEEFEREVERAAQPFLATHSSSGTLVLLGTQGRQKCRGRSRVLDLLALIEPEHFPKHSHEKESA